jgi:hypothetical protein
MECRLQHRPARRRQVKIALAMAACLLLSGVATSARDAVSVSVSPNVSMAPATIRVVVTVEPDAQNRELVIEADSGEYFTSSTVQLDGDKSARLQSFYLKELPAGSYEVAARVYHSDGSSHKATAEYMVLE